MTQPTPSHSLHATRRSILVGGSALAVASFAGWPGHASAAAIDTDAFIKLSQELTGKSDLDADYASRMIKAYEMIGKSDDIAALADGYEDPQLANEIVAAWYSGLSPDPESNEVITYTDALMWEAMSFTKPMGYCGGEMGYWAEPPAG
ncbi:MAG: sugar dehydrogenase complex small subunit [Hoeflea sp.]|uniref:sugar dehydrogenase complex small subunit n=1 Tax=Hoeflea sp. TaxID=1940281 RepID=UPI003EF85839